MKHIFVAVAAFMVSATIMFADSPAMSETRLAAPLAQAPTLSMARPFVYAPKSTEILIGKPDAPVTIVEYASLSCPHCARFFMQVLPDLAKHYIDTGKARLIYRDYPLNAPALKAAELVQCADKGQRHAFLRVLFSTQGKWLADANYTEALSGVAMLGGIDHAKFDACMANKDIEKSLLAVAKEAQDDYKVNSTPTFFIDGKEEKGDHSLNALSQLIEEALARHAKK